MEETKKCKKNIHLPWKTKDFLTITSFLPWKTTKKTRNNSCLPWKKIKKGTVVRCRSAIGWVLLPRAALYHREDGMAFLVASARTSASNTEINSYDRPLRNCASNLSVHLFLVFLVAFLLVFDWKVVSLRAINKENSTSFIVLYLVSNGAEVIVSTFSHTDIDRGYFAFLITQAP